MDNESFASVMKSKAFIIEENRMRYDMLYHIIVNRNDEKRREIVRGIQQFWEKRFAADRENPHDPLFREQMDLFFAQCSRTDALGRLMQTYCIYIAIWLEKRICHYFCPPPPNPDSWDADAAIVDRVVFTKFVQSYLLPMSEQLLNGKNFTIPMYVRELNAMYSTLSPSDPILEIEAKKGRRNVRNVQLLEYK